jgi:hypothetical protein
MPGYYHTVPQGQRFPARIQVANSGRTELRMGQTVSVTISHGARTENVSIIA